MATGRVFTKSCGAVLAVWVLLMGAYAWLAWQRIHETAPAAIIGVLGGTFAGMLISSFIGLFTGSRDRAAIRRALNGVAPRDGRLESAHGPVRALDAPLEAPFTGQPCVAYEYDVKHPEEGRSDFAGYALAPSAIDTPRGSARLLGWAMLDQFPLAPEDRIDRGRGTRYLSSSTFEPLGVTSIISVLGEMVADDDGSIRKDLRIADAPLDLKGRRIEERSLPPGTPVTILGHWSESRQGFVGGGASMNRLFAGDLAAVRRQVGGNAVTTFAAAVFFFVVLHSILGVIYFYAPASGSSRGRTAESVWDERDCDRLKTLLAAGADPNERGRDALTPLMNAARQTEPACVRALIAAGADLEARDKFSDTALVQAVVGGRDDNARVLLDAGAKEFRVTAATGRPITPDAAPLAAVRDYIDAVHRGDFPAMARLMAHASAKRMEDRREDLPMWQSLRPKTFVVEEGWMTDDAATLTIRGATASGDQRVFYHVERQPDGWQIRKEWFP